MVDFYLISNKEIPIGLLERAYSFEAQEDSFCEETKVAQQKPMYIGYIDSDSIYRANSAVDTLIDYFQLLTKVHKDLQILLEVEFDSDIECDNTLLAFYQGEAFAMDYETTITITSPFPWENKGEKHD